MPTNLPTSHKVAIIGAGSVGGAIAQALILRRVVAEIILVDINANVCLAQVNDLSDCAHLSNCKVTHGDSKAAGQADIIIVSAGAKQNPGETRLDLIKKNIHVLRSVIEGMQPIRPDAILLLVSNPVDVLTFFAQKLSGLPQNQVFGSGTLLDSIRLKGMLAKLAGVAETSISAWVIGEHGDSQCVAWSSANCSGVPIDQLFPLDAAKKKEIADITEHKAYEIIKHKGFTSFGVAAIVVTICESIIFDHRQVVPLSTWHEDMGCCLSLPVVLGRGGVLSTIPLKLDDKERSLIENSAKSLKAVIADTESKLNVAPVN
ncbi:lactate dehydrogenase/glycoside hydrolase [Bisporella sp. PMI_857]|nr:lactate dehydrogenase/glycoside hydrolase [Bisporella sp. PMI_857]